jgi:hypothetical protein
MSGECEKCGHHTLHCICEEQEWMNASLGKQMGCTPSGTEVLIDAHKHHYFNMPIPAKEEELEPDFTWKLYRTHLIEEVVHFEGTISILKFRRILTMLEAEGFDHISCKSPVDII